MFLQAGKIIARGSQAIKAWKLAQAAAKTLKIEKEVFLSASRVAHVATEQLTVAGRALSKHPDLVGHTKDTFNLALRSDAARNAVADKLIEYYLKNGVRTVEATSRGAQPCIQYTIAGKGVVRFNPVTKALIGIYKL